MGSEDFYKPGSNASRCQECGQKYHIERLRLRWDNLLTCWRCWEPRQPQDYLRGFPDLPAAPLTTSDPPYVYVGDTVIPNRLIDSVLIGSTTIG